MQLTVNFFFFQPYPFDDYDELERYFSLNDGESQTEMDARLERAERHIRWYFDGHPISDGVAGERTHYARQLLEIFMSLRLIAACTLGNEKG